VHIPYGTYQLTSSVVLPANCNIQLIGDGLGTILTWAGAPNTSAIILNGPSQAILREFYLYAGNGNGIEIQNADQQGSRVYMEETSALRSLNSNVFVDGLDNTLVELHDFQISNTAVAPAATGIGVTVTGGPAAQQGNPRQGRTYLLAGSGGANYLSYKISGGANVVVRDSWYEATFASEFAEVSGNSSFTIEGARIANSGGSGGLAIPTTFDALQVNGLTCSAALLSSSPDSDVNVTGATSGNVWIAGNNFSNASSYLQNSSSGGSGNVAFNLNRYFQVGYGSKPITDLTATPSTAFILGAIAQSRNIQPTLVMDLEPGLTDVRLYRVTVELGNIGIHLEH
jgi:hypothetical protein